MLHAATTRNHARNVGAALAQGTAHMKKTTNSSKLNHKSETVRPLSGRALTMARGGLRAADDPKPCGDTCGGGSGQVSCSHTDYTCTKAGSNHDW